jgi:hypothetical protein
MPIEKTVSAQRNMVLLNQTYPLFGLGSQRDHGTAVAPAAVLPLMITHTLYHLVSIKGGSQRKSND